MRCGSLVGVMIVVPTFAVGNQSDEPIVATVVFGLVVSIAPNVSHRIDAPSDVPIENRSDEHSPDEQTRSELNASPDIARGEPSDRKSEDGIEHRHSQVHLEPVPVPLKLHVERVFEQVSRELLIVFDVREIAILEHQPTEVSPKERYQGTMGIGLVIGMLMMDSMHGDPAGRGVLHGADP